MSETESLRVVLEKYEEGVGIHPQRSNWEDYASKAAVELWHTLATALKRLEAAERLRPEARRLIHVLDDAVPNPGWRTRFLSLLTALAREEA